MSFLSFQDDIAKIDTLMAENADLKQQVEILRTERKRLHEIIEVGGQVCTILLDS